MSTAALIIPAHNRCALTLGCLRHLRDQGDLDRFTVIVIDDGSTDGTTAEISREFPGVTVLPGDGNLWWSGAVSLGSDAAFARGASMAIWLNDDCLPEPGALTHLVDYLAKNERTLAAPACVDARTGVVVDSGFVGRQTMTARPGEVVPVDGLCGFCVGVPRGVWETLGPLDTRHFPHYGGDTAYCLRAARAGVGRVILGDARVVLVAHHDTPTSPAALRQAGRSLAEDYRQVFLSNKSPFRLATAWHLLRLKYGAVGGTLLAGFRVLNWQLRFLVRR